MACKRCGRNGSVSAVAQVSRSSSATSRPTDNARLDSPLVNIRTGRPVPLNKPMVDKKPPGGWVFQLTVKGVPMTVRGTTARDTMAKARHIKVINGEDFNVRGFWVAANLQWMRALPSSKHLVPFSDLEAYASTINVEDPSAPVPPTEPDIFSPEVWGHIGWKWLSLTLARDKYDPVALITAFADVVDMLDEKANPTLGCKECHIEASKELSRLRQYPPETKKEAREWLWEFHNSVNRRLGKPTISFTQAAKFNNWKLQRTT